MKTDSITNLDSVTRAGKYESSQASTGDTESLEASSAGNDEGPVSEESRGAEPKTCRVLGFGTREKSSLHLDEGSEFAPLTQEFLQGLIYRYPRGHVFNPNGRGRNLYGGENPEPGSSKKRIRGPKRRAQRADAEALLQMLPGARSVVFAPLWDSHTERWFAGSFVWTIQSSTRTLTYTEDLNYLAAFGNSIMAEVARVDALGSDRAKSDFISSISHELRSPLHGILASVELLLDTEVDLFQHSLIDTIERCGRTLLDTIQHVLVFAKINKFTSPSKVGGLGGRPRKDPSSGALGLRADVDISLLTEDVINSVFAGYEFQDNSSLVVADKASGFPSEALRRGSVPEGGDGRGGANPNEPGSTKKKRLDVIIDIDWRSNWVFNTQSGALRRVLMNLFGNALKYTDVGQVRVSLQSKDIEPTPPTQHQRSIITISVSDSGRGIGQEYLHHGLFAPFTQEDPLNPGTGLGMSIVLQIVRSLGGTIDVTSEKGVGTEVVVSLTMDQAPSARLPLPLARPSEDIVRRTKDITSGLNIALVGFDVDPDTPRSRVGNQEVKPKVLPPLQASFEGMATHWFGFNAVPPRAWKGSPPDIYIANE